MVPRRPYARAALEPLRRAFIYSISARSNWPVLKTASPASAASSRMWVEIFFMLILDGRRTPGIFSDAQILSKNRVAGKTELRTAGKRVARRDDGSANQLSPGRYACKVRPGQRRGSRCGGAPAGSRQRTARRVSTAGAGKNGRPPGW